MDGSPPVLFLQDLDQAPFKAFKQLFYTSSELSDGDHTLVITNVSDDYDLILDSLVIKSAPPSPSPIVTSPATPPTVTTKLLTSIIPAPDVSRAGTSVPFIAFSSGSTGSSGATNLPAQPTTIPSSLMSVPSPPATSSPSTPSSNSSTNSPLPTPASESHRNHIPTGTIIGLSVGSFIAMASLLLFVYLWRRRRKQQEYSTRPHPLPHPDSHAHSSATQPSPTSSASDHSPPLLSEKSQLRALEAMRDQEGAQVLDLARDNNTLLTPERNTTYSSHPNTQWEGGRDTLVALSHLAVASTASSNTVVAENLVGGTRHKPKAATTSLRMGLLPLPDRVPSNDRSESQAVSINGGSAGSSVGTSSAMGIPNLNSLHQRTTSLSVSDGRVVRDGSGGGNGRRDETTGVFDEPPPSYPETASWSRNYIA